MLKKDLILRNPLRLLGHDTEDLIPAGGLGAVLARAGVGKTALMVQLALNTLLRSKNVLHVSLDDPVDKVALWYQEVFQHLAKQYNVKEIDQLWDTIAPHRFIMTFKVAGFSVPTFKERLSDLTEQGIFTPQMVILDGLPFNERTREALLELKAMVRRYAMHFWLSVKTHRHEDPNQEGLPPQLQDLDDLFDVIIHLQPDGQEIHIKGLKGGKASTDAPDLRLDPATMLIQDKR